MKRDSQAEDIYLNGFKAIGKYKYLKDKEYDIKYCDRDIIEYVLKKLKLDKEKVRIDNIEKDDCATIYTLDVKNPKMIEIRLLLLNRYIYIELNLSTETTWEERKYKYKKV